ncbi:MAG: cation diffusion facilitator family transporter [Myxococcota bacterium]
MTHDHHHAHGRADEPSASDGHAPSRGSNSVALRRAFALTALVLLVEFVGGLLTGSVALLADAGHVLTDAGALGIALFAEWAASQPRGTRHSFGYGRAEVLAALLNGLLLGGVSVGIAVESFARLASPNAVNAGAMMAIAALGLVANLVSGLFLLRDSRHSLNVRAALYHVGGDAVGSLAALSAGACIALFDWRSADAIAGVAIALLLVVSALRLIRDSVDILLEGAPRHLDLHEIARRVNAVPGVARIHDLHIWTVGSGFPAMSAHVDLASGADPEAVRRAVHRLLHQEYAVAHTTIQTESGPPLLQVDGPPL